MRDQRLQEPPASQRGIENEGPPRQFFEDWPRKEDGRAPPPPTHTPQMGEFWPGECRPPAQRHGRSSRPVPGFSASSTRGLCLDTGSLTGTCFFLSLACENLPSRVPPRSPETAVTAAGYLERGGHVGEVRDAASDDEDLAWVRRKREARTGSERRT